MSNTARRTITVSNPQGLHARPAFLIAELASKYESNVEIVKDGERIDGKSIMSILTLAAGAGTSLEIEATGSDAEQAVEALSHLVDAGFPDGKAAPAADG